MSYTDVDPAHAKGQSYMDAGEAQREAQGAAIQMLELFAFVYFVRSISRRAQKSRPTRSGCF